MSSSGSNAKDSNGGEGPKNGAEGETSERSAQPTMCLTSDEVNYLIFRYAFNCYSTVLNSTGWDVCRLL
jgi:hypothetical protein